MDRDTYIQRNLLPELGITPVKSASLYINVRNLGLNSNRIKQICSSGSAKCQNFRRTKVAHLLPKVGNTVNNSFAKKNNYSKNGSNKNNSVRNGSSKNNSVRNGSSKNNINGSNNIKNGSNKIRMPMSPLIPDVAEEIRKMINSA